MNRNRLAWWIAALALAGVPLLGGCKESTATTDEAAAPQAEATAPATPENPLLAMAQVEPGADGQPPRLTLYGLTLDAPLPDYPVCTDDMLWQRNAPGPCFLPNERGGERRPVFELVDELGGVIFPYKMIDAEYPDAITIGFDAQGVQYMRTFPQGGISTQDQYVEMISKLLGEPVLLTVKESQSDDPREKAPEGVPQYIWSGAINGSVIAVWETDYAWVQYLGSNSGGKSGYLEIGLKRILRNGQLPDW